MAEPTIFMTAIDYPTNVDGDPEDEITTQEIVQNTSIEPTLGRKKKILMYIRVLWKSIIQRILTPISIVLDGFAVYQKYIRGHMTWVILSIVFLVIPAIIGSLYSLYFYVMESATDDGSGRRGLTYNESYRSVTYQRTGFMKSKRRPMQRLTEGVNDDIEEFNDDVKEEEEEVRNDEIGYKSSDELVQPEKKRARFADDVIEEDTDEKKVQFEDIPLNIDHLKPQSTEAQYEVKVNDVLDISKEQECKSPGFCHLLVDFIRYDLCAFWPSNKSLVGFHCFLLTREYRFYTISQYLLKYLNQIPMDQKLIVSVKQLEKAGVKKCCVIQEWYDFVKSEATFKQITLLISTLENVILTIVQLLYWSSVYQAWEQSRQAADGAAKSTFNPFEIVTIILSVLQIAYNIVTSYNHQRELNYFKEDISFLHKVWLMFAHMFLILFRMFTFYTLLCLGTQSLIFLLTIICLQFFIYLLAMKDSNRSTPLLAVVVSSILLLFIYAPASQSSSSRTISRISYEIIMMVEFIFICVFSYVHMENLSDYDGLYWMTEELNKVWMYVGFGIAIGCFVLGKLMHMLARCMFKYKLNLDEGDIMLRIREVNRVHGTNWKFLGETKGNDYDEQQTIYL